jgi:alpha-ketoglutarate-dependent taurine dioxygenase
MSAENTMTIPARAQISGAAHGGILAAKRVPIRGGDTLWSSNLAAYDALSLPMRKPEDKSLFRS